MWAKLDILRPISSSDIDHTFSGFNIGASSPQSVFSPSEIGASVDSPPR